MKYLVVSFILFFFTLQTFGQQEYFIYLQTENNQPFYIRVNNNVYSSTSSGYLILSKLADSTAIVTIGFPKNVFPEQHFNIPVNHKDGGYTVKDFGDKGWGLFNLQSMAVIMNNSPAGEKKSPEITTTKKTDAFSMLLANAVNDTSVLYTVNKPPKPVPPSVVAVTEEKKKDTIAVAVEDLSKKDTTAVAKNLPAKKDSGMADKIITPSQKDSGAAAAARIADMAVADKNKKEASDSAAITKNTSSTSIGNLPTAIEPVKNNPPVSGKVISKQKKDTVIVRNSSAPPLTTAVAQAKKERRDTAKERKDTIIFMTGGPAETHKAVAQNANGQKDQKIQAAEKKDSLQLAKKEPVKKREDKATIPVKKDTVAVATVKKDTAALVKNEIHTSPEEKNESNIPVKRQKPAINKAAELLTDTSYVAVFVDESNEGFDTIRISIPFIEPVAVAKQDRQPPKEIKSAESNTQGKIIKDSTPLAITEKPPTPVTKNDTNAIDKARKDSAAAAALIAQRTIAATAKKDSNATGKAAKDSVQLAAAQKVVDSGKKDTGSTIPDSLKTAKTATKPPQSLNPDCKETATDTDIDKLRIKMLVVVSDDDRIVLAKKVFKQKCFSVKQVKALSELFKSDEGKYKWFDAIYPFVSDSGNFSSLGELIKNDYYLNRFKAMLRN